MSRKLPWPSCLPAKLAERSGSPSVLNGLQWCWLYSRAVCRKVFIATLRLVPSMKAQTTFNYKPLPSILLSSIENNDSVIFLLLHVFKISSLLYYDIIVLFLEYCHHLAQKSLISILAQKWFYMYVMTII